MITIDFDDVHQLATVKNLIEPVRRAFSSLERGPERAHYDLATNNESGTLLIMPAWRPGAAIGVKITTVFASNPDRGHPSIAGAYLLLSWATGEPRALIDGRALTLLRTAAVSALAADLLVPPNAEVLLMVGTGALSRYLIEGHLAVRKYKSILIWGRDFRKAETIATEIGARGLPISPLTDLEMATRSADVISCATMSDSALIKGAWLKSRAHLDLVGSFKPTMRETDDECFRRAFIVVDTLDAIEESGDLIGPVANGIVDSGHILMLKNLIERKVGIPHAHHSVFKSVGVALADLAVAEQLFERAHLREHASNNVARS
jgi:ornithine cyclodeaminase